MTDAPYGTETVAAPPAILAELERLAAAQEVGPWQALRVSLAGIAPVVALVFGAIGAVDLVFGAIDRAHWITLALGSAILLPPMLLILLRDAARRRPERDALAAALRAQAASGRVLRHRLQRDAQHWFVEHEHGVIHVCPADAARTLFLDLSSVDGDARHDQWYEEGLIDRARWTWFTSRDGGFLLGFEADGDPVVPNRLAERRGAAEQAGAALFRYLREPAEGALVARRFAEVDAFLRARAAPR